MKTVERVYAGVVPYFTAQDFTGQLPTAQVDNKSTCNQVREADLKSADAFGELLWKGDVTVKKNGT